MLVVLFLLSLPGRATAEWQIRPFMGVTFGGSTTFSFNDVAHNAGSFNVVLGANAARLGDIIGFEADFAHAPGLFTTGDQPLVIGSSATTLTGNLIVAVPRHLTEFTLGPYFVVGAGLMHVRIQQAFSFLSLTTTMPAMDIGGGVTGNLSDRFGLNWDTRYFWSLDGHEGRGLSLGTEQLSFWRAIMALVIRY